MASPPNYRFNRAPRFSANQLAEYLATTHAEQRERIIRSAKFPRKLPVIAYSQSREVARYFLGLNTRDRTELVRAIQRLETRLRREPEGWMRDELQRNIDALERFGETIAASRLTRYHFTPGPVDLRMDVCGVRVNTRLDAAITETNDDGIANAGGCIFFIAGTEQARRNIEERRRSVAALVLWELEHSNPNIEPLPRLCMAFDMFGEEVVRAPSAIDRLRSRMASACAEAAARWQSVEPPTDYDGPDWH